MQQKWLQLSCLKLYQNDDHAINHYTRPRTYKRSRNENAFLFLTVLNPRLYKFCSAFREYPMEGRAMGLMWVAYGSAASISKLYRDEPNVKGVDYLTKT